LGYDVYREFVNISRFKVEHRKYGYIKDNFISKLLFVTFLYKLKLKLTKRVESLHLGL